MKTSSKYFYIIITIAIFFIGIIYYAMFVKSICLIRSGDVSFWRNDSILYSIAVHASDEYWVECTGQRYQNAVGTKPDYMLVTADKKITIFCTQTAGTVSYWVYAPEIQGAPFAVDKNGEESMLGEVIGSGQMDPAHSCNVVSWNQSEIQIRNVQANMGVDEIIAINLKTKTLHRVQ